MTHNVPGREHGTHRRLAGVDRTLLGAVRRATDPANRPRSLRRTTGFRSRTSRMIVPILGVPFDIGTHAAGQRSGGGAPSYESTAAANDGLVLLGVEADFVVLLFPGTICYKMI